MSENTEKCPSQVSGAQGDIVNLLVFFPTVENQRVFTMTMWNWEKQYILTFKWLEPANV